METVIIVALVGPSGCGKTTLGKYLKDHYAFDEKSQEIIDDWDESSLQAYKEYGL